MKYVVSVNSVPEVGTSGTANFNVQVDSPNVLKALDAAKVEIQKVVDAAGLTPA